MINVGHAKRVQALTIETTILVSTSCLSNVGELAGNVRSLAEFPPPGLTLKMMFLLDDDGPDGWTPEPFGAADIAAIVGGKVTNE
jgi:hypothetical protein